MRLEGGVPESVVILEMLAIEKLVDKVIFNLKNGDEDLATDAGNILVRCINDLPKDIQGSLPAAVFHMLSLIITVANKNQSNLGFVQELHEILIGDCKRRNRRKRMRIED